MADRLLLVFAAAFPYATLAGGLTPFAITLSVHTDGLV
jgi:hypothetical protein